MCPKDLLKSRRSSWLWLCRWRTLFMFSVGLVCHIWWRPVLSPSWCVLAAAFPNPALFTGITRPYYLIAGNLTRHVSVRTEVIELAPYLYALSLLNVMLRGPLKGNLSRGSRPLSRTPRKLEVSYHRDCRPINSLTDECRWTLRRQVKVILWQTKTKLSARASVRYSAEGARLGEVRAGWTDSVPFLTNSLTSA